MTDQELKNAAYNLLDDAGYGADDKTMEITSATLAHVAATQTDKAETDRDIDMPHAVWRDVQWHGKGTPRGTLTVLDFGDRRVINFI